jgi:Mn-dependent DtxR family transcriptional regulator
MILSRFLEKLGVDAQTADDDACRIEHHISDESLEAIKKFVDEN